MTHEEISIIISIFGIFFAALTTGGAWNKLKKEPITKQERLKKFFNRLFVIVAGSLIILTLAITFVVKFPFRDGSLTDALPSQVESSPEATSERTLSAIPNSILTDTMTDTMSKIYILESEHSKTGSNVTQHRVETTRPKVATTKAATQNQVYNHRIPIQKGEKTIRLMDIEGANNFVYYLIDNGSLVFSGAGTCVYPLNEKYKILNFSLKVVLPFKKNTTNKANLVISADGKEICSIKFDKDFKWQDKAIDVSNVKTLTIYFEELGYTHVSLGVWMNTPELIYK